MDITEDEKQMIYFYRVVSACKLKKDDSVFDIINAKYYDINLKNKDVNLLVRNCFFFENFLESHYNKNTHHSDN